MGFLMKSQAHKAPKAGHEVPAGVGRSAVGVRGSVQGCPGERPGVSRGVLGSDQGVQECPEERLR